MQQTQSLLQQAARSLVLGRAPLLACGSVRGFAVPAVSQTAAIKQLRERTGAPIADVKALLVEHGWDAEAAYEALRKKGLAAAAKKASRPATEGLVGVAATSGAAAVVELNSETDFVARNELFQGLVRTASQAVLAIGPDAAATAGPSGELDPEQVLSSRLPTGETLRDAVLAVAVKVRENIRLRRAFRVSTSQGVVATYVHMAAAPGMGKLASVVVLEPKPGAPAAQEAGEQLAMHVAGMRPSYVSRADVPPAAVDKERSILEQQLRADPANARKPADIVRKVVEGRLGKWYEDACLLEQRFVLDDTVRVKDVLARLARQHVVPPPPPAQQQQQQPKQGASELLLQPRFLRVQVGEGLQTAAKADFAAEVAKMAQ